jgi:hypothetical protein
MNLINLRQIDRLRIKFTGAEIISRLLKLFFLRLINLICRMQRLPFLKDVGHACLGRRCVDILIIMIM